MSSRTLPKESRALTYRRHLICYVDLLDVRGNEIIYLSRHLISLLLSAAISIACTGVAFLVRRLI